MPAFFVTSCGTDIGKTLVTSALCYQLKQKQKDVFALKPVISGWDLENEELDTRIILQSLGMAVSEDNINRVSPYRFAEPLSPHMAAQMEGREIDFDNLVQHCQQQIMHDYLLIEGIGGVMVPLTYEHTVLDLMKSIAIPAIVVVGNYLGGLSHALTACSVLKAEGVGIQGIVVTEANESNVPLDEVVITLENFTNKPVFAIPKLDYEGDLLYKKVPDLLPLLDM